jgi:hypothetical protein
VPRDAGWKSGNGSAGQICSQALDRRLWWGGDTGGDAYATLGSGTCVGFRPSEKYHRRPGCAAETRAGDREWLSGPDLLALERSLWCGGDAYATLGPGNVRGVQTE